MTADSNANNVNRDRNDNVCSRWQLTCAGHRNCIIPGADREVTVAAACCVDSRRCHSRSASLGDSGVTVIKPAHWVEETDWLIHFFKLLAASWEAAVWKCFNYSVRETLSVPHLRRSALQPLQWTHRDKPWRLKIFWFLQEIWKLRHKILKMTCWPSTWPPRMQMVQVRG